MYTRCIRNDASFDFEIENFVETHILKSIEACDEIDRCVLRGAREETCRVVTPLSNR